VPHRQGVRASRHLRACFPAPPFPRRSGPNPSFLARLARRRSPTPARKPRPRRPAGADNLPLGDPTAMARSPALRRLFQRPHAPAQRHYEIGRAYFHEGSTADQLAEHFQLPIDAVRAIVPDRARDPDVHSVRAAAGPGRKTSPKHAAIHQRARALRRPGNTLGDRRGALLQEGFDVSPADRFRVRRRAGLTTTRQPCCPRSPRRPTPPPRPNRPGPRGGSPP
jgi:hypothetical protein